MNTPTRTDAVITNEQAANERKDTASAEAQMTEQLPDAPAPDAPVIEVEPVVVAQETEPTFLDARQAKLEAIAQKSIEGEVITPLHQEVVDDEVIEVPPEIIEEIQTPEPVVNESPVELIDGVYMATIKVDGVEKKVPFDQLQADAQKVSAADQRFRDASDLMKTVTQGQPNAQQVDPNLPSDDSNNAPPHNGEQQGITTETLNKAMLDGDESSAEEIVNRLNQEQLTPVQFADQVEAEQERRNAVKLVSNADPVNIAIAANPEELAVVDQMSGFLLQTEPTLTAQQNLEQAFALTKAKLGKAAPPPVVESPKPSADETLNERQVAKQAHAGNNLAASSQRTRVGVDAPVYNTKTEVDEMRKTRKARFG